jgi:uncharacterized 2Fe-2S/4Fe-4S cluster protein (DUF4445 family)
LYDIYTITLKPLGQKLKVTKGQTLMEAVRAAGSAAIISTPCGGHGSCGGCWVIIKNGNLSDLTTAEKETFSMAEIAQGYRLACQTKVLGNVEVEIPAESLADQRLNGIMKTVSANGDQGSKQGALGLAIDLGTTKIAGSLVHLDSGTVLASDGVLNPQSTYGHDLMSRLAYAMESDHQYYQLNQKVITGINSLATDLANQIERKVTDISRMVVAANTAMHHIFMKLPLAQLAQAPYQPAVTIPIMKKARDLGLNIDPMADIYVLPPVAGFVGGDHVAMIVGSGLDQSGLVALGLDIGTNTEIVLNDGQRLLTCSCASGPAFEGAHIKHGMQAVKGGITAVRLGNGGYGVKLTTVGNAAPLGISGSGILDAVAELYRTGVINSNGRLDRNHPRVNESDTGMAQFVLVQPLESGTGREIAIVQKDIDEVLLAKAAIATGVALILKAAGLSLAAVQQVVVAGTFGTHLNIASAQIIGLLPPLAADIFNQVGNAAAVGAQAVLVSNGEQKRAERVAAQLEHVELTTRPDFQQVYFSSLTLPRKQQ